MKKLSKKLLALLLTLVITISGIVIISADDDVKPRKIAKIIISDKEITVGEEFELKAITRPGDADDDYLRWKIIEKKGIIRFDDDNDDDEIELVALKEGTTKVRCQIKGKGTKGSKTISITVNKADKSKIHKKGKLKKTVEVGDDFELEVKKSKGLKDRYLKWSIKNKKIVRFDDDGRHGDEAEFKAQKIGKTTITCTNIKTNQKIKFTIIVVPEHDDDDDD